MATSNPNPEPLPEQPVDPGVPEIADEVLADIVGDKPIPTDEEPTSWPLVSFGHVSMWFGERKVLDNVSFKVNRGETLCILGRSGVGKSVSLRILMGFLKPQVGSIRVDGQEINRFTEEEMNVIRRRITMVFQNGALFDSMTVRENVAFPLRERGGQEEDQILQVVDRLLALVGAEDAADALPASLSTGRKRAVAIARALASQPEVVLYDEPTTMVDPLIARRLGGLIQRLKQQLGFTAIVVTHDMRFAERLADTVLFLHEGRAAFFVQTREIVEAVQADTGRALDRLRVDGGMTANGLLLQIQADVLGIPVVRAASMETTALGAAYAAGLAVGYWSGLDEVRRLAAAGETWHARPDADVRTAGWAGWGKAVARSLDWVDPDEEAA